MTRSYIENRFNPDTKQSDFVAKWSFSVYPGVNNCMTVCRNGVAKTVKVSDDDLNVYKLQKTQVKAIGAASGLFKFLDDALFNGFAECLAWKVLNHCFFSCKEINNLSK